MEVEVIMFIFTPLTCLSPGRKRELMLWRGSGNSRALCLAGISNSPRWRQTRCCGRALAGTLGTGCYWSCSPVLLHHLLLFSFSLMEKQTSVAIAGMQHFESARERWAISVLRLPKCLIKLSSDTVVPVFLLEVGVTGMIPGAHLRQGRPLIYIYIYEYVKIRNSRAF